MRSTCIMILLASALTVPTSAAHAAWCASYRTGGINCGFSSFAQCLATIRGDNGAVCTKMTDRTERVPVRQRERVRGPDKPKSGTAARPARPVPTAPVRATAPAAAPPATAPINAMPQAMSVIAQPDAAALNAARKLILDGEYQAGLSAMQALGTDDHPDVASHIGLAYRKLGRNAEARTWYDRALSANPKHVQTLAFSGVLRAETGDLAGARFDLQKIRLFCGNTTCNEYVGLSEVIAQKSR